MKVKSVSAKLANSHRWLDIGSAGVMIFSLFGFLGNVMLDYNWGTNPITNAFANTYTLTLRQLVPFPIGYYGIGAAIYLGLFLLSFIILNRRASLVSNLLETIRVASAVVIFFELGLYYFVPYWMDYWVIGAFSEGPLQYFTNWDLLGIGIACLALSQALLMIRAGPHASASLSGVAP